jgi:hypothetical protein
VTAAATTTAEAAPARPGRLAATASLVLAIVMALTPVSAVLTLGWLVHRVRREVQQRSARHVRPVEGDTRVRVVRAGAGLPGNVLRRLWLLLEDGLTCCAGLALVTLPHVSLITLSWWGGWDNSFNKGYEQAWIGPTLGLFGLALGAVVLAHVPMLTVHGAIERRITAYVDLGMARRLVAAVPWRYLALTLATVAASLPLALMQVSFAFMTSRRPDLGIAELRMRAGTLHLAATAYLVIVLLLLRTWAARLYARAMASDPTAARGPGRRRWLTAVAMLFAVAAWAGFLMLQYVAQFANHAWWGWINHPLIGLPWVFRVY